MASSTQWTWVWTNSGRSWRTGKPGDVLQSTGLQRVRHNWVTEQKQQIGMTNPQRSGHGPIWIYLFKYLSLKELKTSTIRSVQIPLDTWHQKWENSLHPLSVDKDKDKTLILTNEFEQAPGVGNGQVSLACCSPRGCKQSDTTEWLDWTTKTISVLLVNLILFFLEEILDK